jgi:hypothetical protein
MLVTRQANAAQARYKPIPWVTSMPRGTLAGWTVHELTSPALLIRTVQRADPARTNILAVAAAEVDTKKAQVCLITPLGGTKASEPRSRS